MHMGRGRHGSAPEVAARSKDRAAGIRSHQRPRSPEERGAWAKRVRLPQPGNTCRTEIDHEHRQQGNGARWEGSGVSPSSAPMLPASKTTTEATAARTGGSMMVSTPPPSGLLHLPCGVRWQVSCLAAEAEAIGQPKMLTLSTFARNRQPPGRPQTESAARLSAGASRLWKFSGAPCAQAVGKQICTHV